MLHSLLLHRRNFVLVALVVVLLSSSASAQTEKSPSDVVRDFYKAMREHRFKDAWALTIYKPAVDDLNAQELEDLLPDFEMKAAAIPAQVEITGEQIQGNIATVFVKVPVSDATPQVTSEPVNLLKSGTIWIIGDEASQAAVKKGGRRYFLDALIEEHQSDIEDLLKRLIAVQVLYVQQHGEVGDLQALIAATLIAKEAADPRASGYNVRITVSGDKQSYTTAAEA